MKIMRINEKKSNHANKQNNSPIRMVDPNIVLPNLEKLSAAYTNVQPIENFGRI